MASNTPFEPQRLIILSELNTKEKEFYYNLLIRNEGKFHHNDQGHYVVNLRLLAPGIKKIEIPKKKKMINQSNTFPFEERLQLLHDEQMNSTHLVVQIEGIEEFDYNSYPRFALLISNEGDVVQPRLKLLSWLMRYIEDLYDSRFAHEAAEVGREESYETAEKVSSIFPVFVVKRLSMKLGLRSIVEQTCWDLLYNAHTYRRDYLEVEMFCRFLQEFYDHDDLLFFLYVRSVVAKQLHVSFKTRWGKSDGPGRQPKSLWLSYRECVAVARAVFGESNEAMCRDFLAIVTPQMVGQKSEAPPNKTGGGSDTRRIDITQFLHLAVVGYHQTRPDEGSDGDNGSPFDHSPRQRSLSKDLASTRSDGQSGKTPYKTLPGEVNPPVPPVAPSGGDYMSRFAPRSLSVAQNQLPAQPSQIEQPEEPDQYDAHMPDSMNSMDDDYLLRMQRDRDEILEIQRQIEKLNNPATHSEPSYNDGYDYDDRMYDANMDLSALAGAYTPIPHSSSLKYDQYDESGTQSARNPGSQQKRGSSKPHPTLADYTKQKKQMAELKEQYGIPDIDADGGYYDDVLTPNKDLWNPSEPEYRDEILEDQYDPNLGQEDYDPSIFSEIQVAREKEFLELFCESLSGFPEEIAVSIIDELADRLRHKLSSHLESLGYISDPDQYDDEIVNYLQSEELQSDLENARDLMIDYVEKRSQQLRDGDNEDGHGHDERKSSNDAAQYRHDPHEHHTDDYHDDIYNEHFPNEENYHDEFYHPDGHDDDAYYGYGEMNMPGPDGDDED